MSQFIAILDACVLYPAPVRDILLSLAAIGLFQPKWTDEIKEEWVRNLLEKRKDLKRGQLARTVAAMNKAFRYANVTDYDDLIPSLQLPDEDDRHVLASAIKSEANVILTFNLKDFPDKTLETFQLKAQNPDDFILELFEQSKGVVCEAIKRMISRLQNPPKTKDDIVETLRKCKLLQAAEKIKECC